MFTYNHPFIAPNTPSLPLPQRCCALFVSEVLKRCVHKEMTVEYRAVAVNLQEEVMIALLCPTWPVVAILHDQLVRRLSSDLAANVNTLSSGAAGLTSFPDHTGKQLISPPSLIPLIWCISVHARTHPL